MDTTMLDAATELAGAGLYLFPLSGKRPLTGGGWHDAQPLAEIDTLPWARATGIGLWPGGSGLYVLDIDLPIAPLWAELIATHGEPTTLTVETGGGGLHYYFRARDIPPEDRVTQHNGVYGPDLTRLKGIDGRGMAGYVIVPPSIHPGTGTAYMWRGGEYDESKIAPLAAYPWIVELVTRKKKPAKPTFTMTQTSLPLPQLKDSDSGRMQARLDGVLHAACTRVAGLSSGRYEAVRNSAIALGGYCHLGLSPIVVATELVNAYQSAGGSDPGGAARAIEWGLQQGQMAPMELPDNVPMVQIEPDAEGQPTPLVGIGSMSELFETPGTIQTRLTTDRFNEPMSTTVNIQRIITMDKRLAKCRFNLFSQQVMWGDRPASDIDALQLAEWLCDEYVLKNPSKANVVDGMMVAAHRRAYDPICDYLRGLEWDGTARINTFLTDYFSVEETEVSEAYSRKWLLSMVARAFSPGCKVDTVLILTGKQGAHKSSGFRALARPEFFSDSPLNLENKDSFSTINGKWLYEMAELDAMRGKAASTIKAFITSQVDNYRPAFGRFNVNNKRRTVFVGTANRDEVLADPTGDRRFWVGKVTGRVDAAGITKVRDQIWAEAMHEMREDVARCGCPIDEWAESPDWQDTILRSKLTTGMWWLTEEEDEIRKELNKQHQQGDPWEDIIATHIDGKYGCSRLSSDLIAGEVLALEPSQQTAYTRRRITAAMLALGWEPTRYRDGGRRVRGFVKEQDLTDF